MDKLFKIMPLFYYDIAAVIVFLTLFMSLRKSREEVKSRVLFSMCAMNFIFYIINDYYFYIRGDNILTLMPLQLCNIAVFLIPSALKLKKQLLYDFVFYICALGAFAALMVPSTDYLGRTYSLMTISFFIFHFMIVAIPFLLVAWEMYNPTPTIKKALNLSAAIFVFAGAMHLFNLALGSVFQVKADYFFTIIKYSAPSDPAFELLSKIIPYDFFYLLPALPILYVYMMIVYIISKVKCMLAKDRDEIFSREY